jgi:hypothetical protein
MFKLFYYLKEYFYRWFAIFIATISVTITILSFSFKVEQSLYNLFLVLIISLFLSSLALFIVTPIQHFAKPFDPKDVWLLDKKVELKILFPYLPRYLNPVNKIAKLYYGKNYSNIRIAKKWYEKNKYTLSVLADENNEIVGYFDILPFNEEYTERFISGELEEKDIKPEFILCESEMKNCKTIYFAGIAVAQNCNEIIRIFGGPLIYAAISFIELFFDLEQDVKIIALPVTECGKRLLKNFKFTILVEACNRKDGFDLMYLEINSKKLRKFKNSLKYISNRIDLSNYNKFKSH